MDKLTYSILDYYGSMTTDEICAHFSKEYPYQEVSKSCSEIQRIHNEQGFFSVHRPKKLEFPLSINDYKCKLNEEMQLLILGITEQCNLRCKYCVFSGGYSHQRTHSNKIMSYATAKKAIDIYYAKSIKTKHPAISFYGGEPLIVFSLLKRIIKYAREKFGNRINLQFTTNGTLLKDDVVKFMMDNQVAILISLDGPQFLHDKMRIYPNSGGTYEDIISNIRKIKENYPDYYQSKIGYRATVSMYNEIESIYNYFIDNKQWFDKHYMGVGYVDSVDNNLQENKILSIGEDARVVFKKMQEKYKDQIIRKGKPDVFLNDLFGSSIRRIHNRETSNLGEAIYPNGICSPGIRRLFCTTEGVFTICERVNPGLIIGHIDTGIDVDAIYDIINKYISVSTDSCTNCWAVRICKHCFVDIFSNHFDIQKKNTICDIVRNEWTEMIKLYCLVRESKENAFEYLQ